MEMLAHYLCAAYIFCFVNASVGSPCTNILGGNGYCVELQNCPILRHLLKRRIFKYWEVECDPTGDSYNLVCCGFPSFSESPAESPASAPKNYNYDQCGQKYNDFGSDLSKLYPGNDTAEELIRQGFTIEPIRFHKDHLVEFSYFNSTYYGYYRELLGFHGGGGRPARRILAVYMALLEGPEDHICGGALINGEWILTAAHCFDFLDRQSTFVTLGDYDIGDDTIRPNEYPIKFTIKEVVRHPEYRYPSKYHDLALIRLNEKIPALRPDIKPVCLPWGDEATKKHIGNTITLTGWGQTIFDGDIEPVLQEVNLTVFHASVCDAGHSTLRHFKDHYPKGITENVILCAGDEEGGKDACKGDSGGPVVYEADRETYHGKHIRRYTLAGIVSAGYGCGLKKYPGIFMPINSPKYLSWIKKVAFT